MISGTKRFCWALGYAALATLALPGMAALSHAANQAWSNVMTMNAPCESASPLTRVHARAREKSLKNFRRRRSASTNSMRGDLGKHSETQHR
jgi:hypothetical protein